MVITGEIIAGTIAIIGLIAWAVRVEMRGRSNTHRIDKVEGHYEKIETVLVTELKEVKKELSSMSKSLFFMMGKLGIEPPTE